MLHFFNYVLNAVYLISKWGERYLFVRITI